MSEMKFEITSSEISRILASFRSDEPPLRALRFYVWGEDPEIFDYKIGEIDSALDKLHELSLVYFVSHAGFMGDVIDGVYGVSLTFEKSEDGETNVDCGVFEAVCNALNPIDNNNGLGFANPIEKTMGLLRNPIDI